MTNNRRAEGLLIIEVNRSNPNGDPNQGGYPRISPGGYGQISDVSIKRKIRDIVANKDNPIWKNLAEKLNISDPEHFNIAESDNLYPKDLANEASKDVEAFHKKYWDARVFGNTYLEKAIDTGKHIRSGVIVLDAYFESIAPVELVIMTCTRKMATEKGKSRGMAPDRIKVIQHGIYCGRFFIDYHNMHTTYCDDRDIELFMEAIPYTYIAKRSTVRPHVNILSAPYVEFKKMACPFEVLDVLLPQKNNNPNIASVSRHEYTFPPISSENPVLKEYLPIINKVIDLAANGVEI